MKRLSCLLVLALVAPAVARWYVDIEAGPVFSGYNNVRIPGNTGTLLSLTEDLTPGPRSGFGPGSARPSGTGTGSACWSRRCGSSPAEP